MNQFRKQSFTKDPSLLGHEAVRQKLFGLLGSGKLPGSLLFAGPDAVGKRRVAFELAMRELCFRRTACGSCEGCLIFKAAPLPNVFPNLLRIAPEGKAGIIKVDAIRGDAMVEGGVICWAHQAPPPGCHRWVVIEDAHRLGKSGANILLKTLEEPPLGTFFILVTHRPESVLATIRSRSMRVPFAPLSEAEATKVAQGNGWGGAELGAWAAMSNGTLKLLDRDAFDRASAQMEAWLSIMEGAPFAEASEALLPDKKSDLAVSQQTLLALEQLLVALKEAEQARLGLPGRLGAIGQWGARFSALGGMELDIRRAFNYALESMRALQRNASPELILRKIALALQSAGH